MIIFLSRQVVIQGVDRVGIRVFHRWMSPLRLSGQHPSPPRRPPQRDGAAGDSVIGAGNSFRDAVGLSLTRRTPPRTDSCTQ